MPAPSGPPTLDSVAAAAGVSRQTVSNVLRHPGRVSPATSERVREAIRSTGYRPSLPARQLATRRSNAVAVRAERQQDGISGLVLDAFYHGLAEAGHAVGLHVLLYPEQDDEAAELAVVDELLRTRAADALVLTATSSADTRPQHLREAGLPFCAFGRPWGEDDDRHDWVDVDGAAGTGMAVRHLRERGRRRIAYLGWPDDVDPGTGADRRRGWAEELHGSPVEAHCVNDAGAAEAAVRQLLDDPEPPDAVVCASDTLALGAHRAGAGQLEVVGFDATPVTAALGLASVRQPVDRAAHSCLDLLRQRLEAPDTPTRHVLLQPTLRVP